MKIVKYIFLTFIIISILSSCGNVVIRTGATMEVNTRTKISKGESEITVVDEDEMIEIINADKNEKLIHIWWSADCRGDNCKLNILDLKKMINDNPDINKYIICLDYYTKGNKKLIRHFLNESGITIPTYFIDNSPWRMLTWDLKNDGETEDFIQEFNPDYELFIGGGLWGVIWRSKEENRKLLDSEPNNSGRRMPYTLIKDDKNEKVGEFWGEYNFDKLNKAIESLKSK